MSAGKPSMAMAEPFKLWAKREGDQLRVTCVQFVNSTTGMYTS